MASPSMVTVDLYRQTKEAGVLAIREVGSIDVRALEVIYAFSGGVEDENENPNFKVQLKGGKSFRTNWSGVSDLRDQVGSLNVRANEYVRVKQEDGSYLLTYTGNGYFVNALEVSTMEEAGTGDNDGSSVTCWKVVLSNGFTFFTDQEDRDIILALG